MARTDPNSLERRKGSKLPDKYRNKNNHSKINIEGYFVDVNYPQDQANFHNVAVIHPKSFPNRTNVNFINKNRAKDQVHKFDKYMAIPEPFEPFNSFYSTQKSSEKSVPKIKLRKKTIGGLVSSNDGVI